MPRISGLRARTRARTSVILHLGGPIVAALLAAVAQAESTAVYTYDVQRLHIQADEEPDALTRYAERCRLDLDGAAPRLRCEAPPRPPEDAEPNAAVVLFQTLEEVLVVAGCPAPPKGEDSREERKKQLEERETERDLLDRLCRRLRPRATYSAEIDDERIDPIVMGRPLPLGVFRRVTPERHIATPYQPKPTKGSLGPAGPPTTTLSGAPNPPPPDWNPLEVEPTLAKTGRPRASLRTPQPAKTGLESGRLRIRCSRGEAAVAIDGAGVGRAPLELPIAAGAHSLVATWGGKTVGRLEVEIEAGEDMEVDVCGPAARSR